MKASTTAHHSNEYYDGLPPSGLEVAGQETNSGYKLDMLRGWLDRIASGDSVAWHLSTALESLQSAVSGRDAPRISKVQRDRLLKALVWARGPIVALFDSPNERALAEMGVDATAGLVCIWAESDQQRASRHRHVQADLHTYARILRNAAHNLSLLNQVRERADQRRSETVAEILQRAVA